MFIVHTIISRCSSGDRDPTDPGLLEYDEETQGNKEGRNLTIPSTDPQFKITKKDLFLIDNVLEDKQNCMTGLALLGVLSPYFVPG